MLMRTCDINMCPQRRPSGSWPYDAMWKLAG